MAEMERELGWNDTIENDSSFTEIEDGEYNFEVKSWKKGRHEPKPGSKLPPCNKAILDVEIYDDDGRSLGNIDHNLFLHSRTEGLICQFFRSIGSRKHGEKLQMNWNTVPGSKGRCKIKNKTEDSRKHPGEKVTYCQIDKFLDPAGNPGGKADEDVAF